MDSESGEVLPQSPGPLGPGLTQEQTEKPMTVNAVRKEEVIREFPPVGKYRIRLLAQPKTQVKSLDIREYVVSPNVFEGFTRRGIHLSDRAQVDLLRDVLSEVLRDLLL